MAAGAGRAPDSGTGGLSIGVGRVEITPPEGVPMAGFAARHSGCTGVHDPLFASAVVAGCERTGERVAVLAVDVVGLDDAEVARVRQGVEEAIGIPASNVVVAATHTHSGPSVMPGRLGGGVDTVYLDRLVARAVEAAVTADSRRFPGRMRLRLGCERTLARNRRLADGPIDPDVPALWIDHGQAPTGVLVSYACHPTVLSHENLLVTRDYPGAVVDALENRVPGLLAMFATGCAGDLNPGYDPAPGAAATGGRTFDEADRVGHRLGDAAAAGADIAGAPDPARSRQVAVATEPVELPLLPPEPDLADRAVSLREAAGRAEAGRARWLRIQADWAEHWARRPAPEALSYEVTAVRIGGILLLAAPGEPFAALGQRVKARLGREAVTLAYANGCPGYIPEASAYDRGGYEVDAAHRYYGQPAAFGPGAAGRLLGATVAAGREAMRR